MLTCTVLPTYNERENIGPLITRLLASVPAPYMVLVVDDNSPDGTWQVVAELAARENSGTARASFSSGAWMNPA